MKKNKTIAFLAALLMATAGNAQIARQILGDGHAMVKVDTDKRYLLLPVEEKEENAHIRVVKDNQLTLRNGKGEKVTITYDATEQTIDFDRRRSGEVSFSDAFPCIVTSPTYGQVKTLRIFIDRCSMELFDGEGKMAMTNLVFPTEPYNKITVKGKAKATVYRLKL